jgi:hypothetical protein
VSEGTPSNNNFVFDPFGDAYGDKIEFTEATDFTEGTDFFAPFSDDPVSFSPREFTPKPVEEYMQHDLAKLVPPSGSGSQYDLWNYDADTSTLHEGAAEI